MHKSELRFAPKCSAFSIKTQCI